MKTSRLVRGKLRSGSAFTDPQIELVYKNLVLRVYILDRQAVRSRVFQTSVTRHNVEKIFRFLSFVG